MSELTKGMDSTKSVKNSARLNRISKKRACQIDDFFYKAAHYIVDFCLKNKVEVIVCGHNKDQKQEINLGSGNNQHFVSIPYTRFFWILTCVAAKAGIPVIETEESYTSKASLIDKDPIPVYKEGDRLEYHFSGKRISRGQYKSKEGTILNADVNGAGNIIRKIYPNAFDEVKDFAECGLCGTAAVIRSASGVETDRLCRYHVLRCRLYPSDRRSERDGSDHCIADPQPRVLYFCAGWLAAAWPDLKYTGRTWLCCHVCGDHSGSASGEGVLSAFLRYSRGVHPISDLKILEK